jgi:hypothetical protein
MKRLHLIGVVPVIVALAGCGKTSFEQPPIAQLEHCARASAEYAAALETRVRLTTYRRDQGQFRHSEWNDHFLAAWSAAEYSIKTAEIFRARACSSRADLPSDLPSSNPEDTMKE